MVLATAPADSAETFTVRQRSSALYHTVKVAGGGPSVHACAVFFSAQNRVMGMYRARVLNRAPGSSPALEGGRACMKFTI